MAVEVIKSAQYRTLGYIETRSDGKQVAKDAHYRILGYFNPSNNETRDTHFRVLGHGNLLASLIACDALRCR